MQQPVSQRLRVLIAVSDAEEDKFLAKQLGQHLQPLSNDGLLTYWSSDQIAPGKNRAQEIKEQCRWADLFLLLLSVDFIVSSDCQNITDLALEREREEGEGKAQIFSIKLRDVHLEWAEFQQRRMLPRNQVSITRWPDRDQAWVEIVDQIRTLCPPISLPLARNPYKGLHAFQPGDAADFFGREATIENLYARLQLFARSQTRLLTVDGPSGVGKSSVVLAGLLPRLGQEFLDRKERWVVLPSIRLNNNPLQALVASFATSLPNTEGAEIYSSLQARSMPNDILHTYAALIAKPLPSEAKVVLVIDQFEDLFQHLQQSTIDQFEDLFQYLQQSIQEDDWSYVLLLLLEAVQTPGGRLCVICTLRTDFIDHLLGFPQLAKIVFEHRYTVLPMPLTEMRRAIEEPAFHVNVQFDKYLVERILQELQGQANALPMLQFALAQIFTASEGRRITQKAYDEIGGVGQAIGKHAEETYKNLASEQHRKWVRWIFLRLVNVSISGQEIKTRKQVLQSDLVGSAKLEEKPIVQQSIDAFVDAHLLTRSLVENIAPATFVAAPTLVIEVSHEAVLQEWPSLKEWLCDKYDDLHMLQNLNITIREWERQHKASAGLYRGQVLKKAEAWQKHMPVMQQEQEFLRASRQKENAGILRNIMLWSLAFIVVMATIGRIWWGATHPFVPDPTRVTNTQDSGAGSLRWCLANAPTGSTIMMDAGVKGTIILKSTLTINKRLTIKGPGENVLMLRGTGTGTTIDIVQHVEGDISIFGIGFTQGGSKKAAISPIAIDVEGFSTLYLNHVHISHTDGTGIENSGTVTIENSSIDFNTSHDIGGILNTSTGIMTIRNSTIANNSSSSFGTGGIANVGTLTIANSTIAANSARDVGGIANSGTLTITNSTLTNNTSIGVAGISTTLGGKTTIVFCTFVENRGKGIAMNLPNIAEGKTTMTSMQNTLLVSSPIVLQDPSSVLQSKGYNLVDATNAHFFRQIGDRVVQDPFDLFENGALLEQNGGGTPTIKLRVGSEAYNVIPIQACHIQNIRSDQRDQPRPGKGKARCDIGAYEA
jgi:AAA ATPase domain/TIR domain/Right handed beta helix region